jgi:hypothetical protein
MDDLIAALNILRKYLEDTNANCPLNTSHDMLWIMQVDPDDVSAEDLAELDRLGFYVGDEAFQSSRFGSA